MYTVKWCELFLTGTTGERSMCEEWMSGLDLGASLWPEGIKLHKHHWAPCNPPRVGLISYLLQDAYKFYSFVRMKAELLQNMRFPIRDIFCQLHHLFLPLLSLKGILPFFLLYPLMPVRLCIETLPKAFQQTLKHTLQLCLGFVLPPRQMAHMMCFLIMFYWCTKQKFFFFHLETVDKGYHDFNWLVANDVDIPEVCFSDPGDFFCCPCGRKYLQMHKSWDVKEYKAG